jgi:hypothetical protein
MFNLFKEKDKEFSSLEQDSSLEQEIQSMLSFMKGLEKGDNLLVDTGDTISLIKYENFDVSANNPLQQRVNRHVNLMCMGNVIRPYWAQSGEGKKKWDEEQADHPFTHIDLAKRINKQIKANFYGTHRIDFTFDREFGIYLVDSDNIDLYLNIANEYANGDVRQGVDSVKFIIDNAQIEKRLIEITRPEYFYKSIKPFLESRSTGLNIPMWNKNSIFYDLVHSLYGSKNKPKYLKFDMSVAWNWLNDVAKNLDHGDFIYVGCKEEVYLLGITKPEGKVINQGTYTLSTKPMLFFTNTFVEHIDPTNMKRRLWTGDPNEPYNCAEYRGEDPPSFDGTPYVFSAIGRKQRVKSTLFTGEPEIITGNLDEALAHFRTTDFSEFESTVRHYADRIREPTPDIRPNSGCFFY